MRFQVLMVRISHDQPAPDGLVVGYASPPDHAFGAALEALCRALPPG